MRNIAANETIDNPQNTSGFQSCGIKHAEGISLHRKCKDTLGRGSNASGINTSGIRGELDGMRNKIEKGDRIFARLTSGGKTVAEFMTSQASSMSDIIGELRHVTYGQRGLCKLYVRNHSKGWSRERPMMLYSPEIEPRKPMEPASASLLRSASASAAMLTSRPHTIFPWETH